VVDEVFCPQAASFEATRHAERGKRTSGHAVTIPPEDEEPALGMLVARARRDRLTRASLGTASGTVLSRLTGLFRLVMIAYALGGFSLGDAFNLANNTPNMVHDLVLGGILSATFVPVFVSHLATRSRQQAVESISAVVTLSGILLVVSTVAFIFAAPAIIDLYTLGKTLPNGEHVLAVDLLRFFAPQLLFYGAISLISAVLATRDKFAIVGFVPIVNNIISIAVLYIFHASFHAPKNPALWPAAVHHDVWLMFFLGVGTTLGVAAQAIALLPSMRRAHIGLRFVFRLRDPAVHMILTLSKWTFGFVAISQIVVFIIQALAIHLGAGQLSAYTYAYTFFQFPFAVVAISIVNVASPDFARAHTAGNLAMLGGRFGIAARQILALILPAMVGYLILARPAMEVVLQHGAESQSAAHLAASVLALFSLGLPGYCIFFLTTRTYQAMQDTKTVFKFYGLASVINVAAAIAMYRPLGVRGLALAYAIAYSITAVVSLVALRNRLGTIGGRALLTNTARTAVVSIFMAFVVALVSAIIGTSGGPSGALRLIVAAGVGAVAYFGAAGVAGTLSSWQTSRRSK